MLIYVIWLALRASLMSSPQLAKVQFLQILLNYDFNWFLKLFWFGRNLLSININSSNLMQVYLFPVVKGLSYCLAKRLSFRTWVKYQRLLQNILGSLGLEMLSTSLWGNLKNSWYQYLIFVVMKPMAVQPAVFLWLCKFRILKNIFWLCSVTHVLFGTRVLVVFSR